MTRQAEITRFLTRYGWEGAGLCPLAGDASFRRYIRVRAGDRKAMLMDAPPEKENVRSYLAVARYLHTKGYSVPDIFAGDEKAGLILMEDLGDDIFTRLLKSSQDENLERTLYAAAIDVLAEWHERARLLADPHRLPLPLYDETLLMQEVRLFCDWYLPQVLGLESASALKAEYLALWRQILSASSLATDCFVHRDYHADNLLWLPERRGTARVGLLDFQDGVYGDAAYDLVSLLEDARRDVPPALAEEMLSRYLAAASVLRDHFMMAYAVLGAQRNSKIIGIFVRLAARDNKYAYLDYLPRVWRLLEQDIRHPALASLKAWLDRHVPSAHRGAVAVKHTARDLALTA